MSYDLLFNKALSLHDAGQLDEAEKVYRQILETAPNNAEVLNLLGLVAQAKGLQQQAEELFYFALKQKPDFAPFYYNLAFSFKLDNKPLEAIENFEKVIALKPDIKEAYNELGLLHESIGNTEKALQNWHKALELDENYPLPQINIANCLAEKDLDKSIECLISLINKYPDEPLTYFYLTRHYMEISDWGKALETAQKAEFLLPASDDIKAMLGQIFQAMGNVSKAKEYFEKAKLLNADNIPSLLALADFYANENNFSEAERYYKRVIELAPKNFDVHNNYAGMLYKQQRTAEALEEYRQAVILNPKSAAVSNNLAIILRSIGDYEQALGLLFNALNCNPDMDEISVNLFETLLLYYRTGNADALQIAQNWFKNMPDNVFAKRLVLALNGEKNGGNPQSCSDDFQSAVGNIQSALGSNFLSSEDNQSYSEKLFDRFADNYELVMQTLDFAVPMAMGRIAGSVEGRIVDIGCGTGLLGMVVKTPQNYLIGVDISAKMLEKASEKKVYDELIKSEAVAFLQKNKGFDWVMAADVLGYIGALKDFFLAANGSKLCFSTENLNDGDFKLDVSGRFKHNPQYVRKILTEVGYKNIYQEEIILRTENNENVRGTIWKAE